MNTCDARVEGKHKSLIPIRISDRRDLKFCCERGMLLATLNEQKAHAAKYGNKAVTRHSEESVLPRHKQML